MEMVSRCNRAGVRIYVDAVFNHMTGDHQQAIGTGRSWADTFNRHYFNVPYTSEHFHYPSCGINNYNDAANVRNCELVGLHDLDQSSEYVRKVIVDFMNDAIDIGVAGFRLVVQRRQLAISQKKLMNIFINTSTVQFQNRRRETHVAG